jgi:hypothetical protein
VTSTRNWRRRVLVNRTVAWLRILLQVAWKSPVDHPREAALIFSARMAVLFGTATIAVTLILIVVAVGWGF